MHHIESAGIVVYHMLDHQPVYLLLKYSNGGHWDFAKGKIEAGETKETAALRELHEEAGIEATMCPGFEYSFSYHYLQNDGAQVRKAVYFFVGIAYKYDVVLSSEHTQYRWMMYEDALALLSFDTAKQLLSEVHAFNKKKNDQ